MKRIAKDTAFTLWTAKLHMRVIKRRPDRSTIEILNGLDLVSAAKVEAYFVPGCPVHIIHPGALCRGNYNVR